MACDVSPVAMFIIAIRPLLFQIFHSSSHSSLKDFSTRSTQLQRCNQTLEPLDRALLMVMFFCLPCPEQLYCSFQNRKGHPSTCGLYDINYMYLYYIILSSFNLLSYLLSCPVHPIDPIYPTNPCLVEKPPSLQLGTD